MCFTNCVMSKFPLFQRNILYQYMLGKESMTLAKVLATVVKFSPEQVRQIMSQEEKKQSLLASLGLVA